MLKCEFYTVHNELCVGNCSNRCSIRVN